MCTSFVIFSFNDKSLTLREELGLKNGSAWLGLKKLEGGGRGGRSASPPDARYQKQIIHISFGQVAYVMYKYTVKTSAPWGIKKKYLEGGRSRNTSLRSALIFSPGSFSCRGSIFCVYTVLLWALFLSVPLFV